jgi:hypothetical protein
MEEESKEVYPEHMGCFYNFEEQLGSCCEEISF